MKREQVLVEIEKAQKATPGPWQTRFIFRSLACARKHAAEDHLLLEGDAKQDWLDADMTASAGTNYLGLLRQMDSAMVILRRKHDDDHPGWRTCPCADAEKIRDYFGD